MLCPGVLGMGTVHTVLCEGFWLVWSGAQWEVISSNTSVPLLEDFVRETCGALALERVTSLNHHASSPKNFVKETYAHSVLERVTFGNAFFLWGD